MTIVAVLENLAPVKERQLRKGTKEKWCNSPYTLSQGNMCKERFCTPTLPHISLVQFDNLPVLQVRDNHYSIVRNDGCPQGGNRTDHTDYWPSKASASTKGFPVLAHHMWPSNGKWCSSPYALQDMWDILHSCPAPHSSWPTWQPPDGDESGLTTNQWQGMMVVPSEAAGLAALSIGPLMQTQVPKASAPAHHTWPLQQWAMAEGRTWSKAAWPPVLMVSFKLL